MCSSDLVRTPGLAAIAKKWNLPVAHVAKLVEIGAKTEFEHNKNLDKARQVARDHIAERPDYYQKLKKMEKSHISMKEMDMSGMPMSKNIEDRRPAERKADDATIKPGQDIGSVKGPSYSWMKSPTDWGSPTKPDYGYDMSSTKNYNAPNRNPFPDQTTSNVQQIGRAHV